MAKRRASLKGRGPELLGKGVDLLFEETDHEQATEEQESVTAPASGREADTPSAADAEVQAALASEGAAAVAAGETPTGAGQPAGAGHHNGTTQPAVNGHDDPYLRAAAHEFLQTVGPTLPPELAEGLPPAGDWPVASEPVSQQAGGDAGTPGETPPATSISASSPSPTPVATQPNSEMEPTMPHQRPATSPEAQSTQVSPGMGQGHTQNGTPHPEGTTDVGLRAVGAPGVTVSGPVTEVSGATQPTDGQLSPEILKKDRERISAEDRAEILGRLSRRDLERLDKEVDQLYGRVAQLMSGERESNIAFDALRRTRQILLVEPERFAEAEYLIQQIHAALNRMEQSMEAGARYGMRLFAYQVIWLVVFSGLALLTTVPDSFFFKWTAVLLGVPDNSQGLGWAMLFLSTLAWGGIGGVTGALWSLHYHISVVRDYDPVENMWYLEQPVLGMVLGGIVYLIMASGFLIVQADLSGPQAALGARLLPAAVSVVAGFRQTVVLDLIERVVKLLAPQEEQPSAPRPSI